ncbi:MULTISPECIES: ASKHA domain-containing protein [unclassified Methanoregula]|uniref:ASKHA domain-containing protein n=1 Tax=unclassified Methanoregula TaxID=2649730 RepID=UPI0009D1F3F7|nr:MULTISPECIES: ASKHA domain-containing protein [unclassified Methanoregula]OPX65063.1 MAG: Na(+)-translocating NADH-quinone reductase subunit F [Methanoregula sp. PtaB.Bin085]OPY32334.1 MAG: Na(+)-translocating NADH-quinone reductase subunit F [Methanoregula sp. PtaU1.Bin006]
MPDTARVIFHPMARMATVPVNTPVLEAIRQAGIPFESVCGGKGECNKCRVVFVKGSSTAGSPASVKGLTPEEIGRQYCRACQTLVTGDCEFIIPVESRISQPRILVSHTDLHIVPAPVVRKYLLKPSPGTGLPAAHRSIRLEGYTGTRPHMTRQQHDELLAADGMVTVTITAARGYPEVIRIESGDTRDRLYGIAVDLGTTTVAGALVDLVTGKNLAGASAMNRQITFGEELLTRITHARTPDGREDLRKAAVQSINEVIGILAAAANVPHEDIADVCIAGNTVMSYLLLGRDTRGLDLPNPDISRDPVIVPARSLQIEACDGACAWILPAVSRFVGGDAVGDVLVSGMPASRDLSFIIDLGTNGEIILGSGDWLASVSCASGPAFEGAGISSGMRAMQGAIDHVTIDPSGCTVSFTTIGNTPPLGICGSGIIDAAAAMVSAGILDFTGKLVGSKPGVRTGADGPEFLLVSHEKTGTGRDICITAQDMLYLMDSKAAVCGAIGVLMKKYRVRTRDIRHLFLAGAFGAFSDMKNIIAFGIVPDFKNAEYHSVGNGSLSGAMACLLSQDMRTQAQAISRQMVYIDLLIDTDFIEEYTAALHIPGKKEYFS